MIKALAITSLVLTEDQETTLIRVAEDGAKHARRSQGLTDTAKPGDEPIPYSWLWWRWIAERAYDNDFSWRPGLPPRGKIDQGVEGMKVFTKSNQSMNTPQDHLRQLKSKISGALLKDHRFFGHKAEGPEDAAHPAIPAIQRRLRHRSKVSGFRDSMESCIFKSLLCGESVCIPSYKKVIRYTPIQKKVAMDDKGFPIISAATKSLVMEDDEWVPGPDGRDVLKKDPSISKSAGSEVALSTRPAKILQPRVVKSGADFNLVHYMDLIVDTRWTSLDEADLIGNEFSWTFDELRAFLSNSGQIIPGNLEEYKTSTQTGSAYLDAKSRAKPSRGEVDTDLNTGAGAGSSSTSPEMQPRIRMRQYFLKADILGVGARQNIWCIMDVELNQPIIYSLAEDVLDVDPDRGHPYRVIRAIETSDRWYGVSLYETMWDDLNTIDSRLNQISVACASAGNAVFVNSAIIKDYKNNKQIRLNSSTPNEVERGADPREAIHVEEITPQIKELEDSLNLALQRAQSKFGLSGAGQTVTQALPGTETATGQQILEDNANQHVESMIKELGKGIDQCVSDFMKIELDNIDTDDLLAQLGEVDAQLVLAWVEENKAQYTNAIEVVLSSISDTQTLAKNSQIIQILMQWMQWPPAYQAIHKTIFIKMLRDLDCEDPESLLVTTNEIMAASQPQPQQPNEQQPGQQAATDTTATNPPVE
jgi:hypothetical protein